MKVLEFGNPLIGGEEVGTAAYLVLSQKRSKTSKVTEVGGGNLKRKGQSEPWNEGGKDGENSQPV